MSRPSSELEYNDVILVGVNGDRARVLGVERLAVDDLVLLALLVPADALFGLEPKPE